MQDPSSLLVPEAPELYDVAIAGGGLAGLALSIQLRRQGHTVILFEKESYPFHKVCGEYISLESWDFLNGLGIDPDALHSPIITKLQVSSVNGKLLEQPLPLGGFGLSRYCLDAHLARIAATEGAIIMQNTKVNDLIFSTDEFIIDTSPKQYRAKLACGSFGKRSNIDIKWKRRFSMAARNKLNHYIGVKYHVLADFPTDTIALHNFRNGYCGLVKIEGDQYNLCYLTTADNLQKSKGDIREMERNFLCQNPHLKKIFAGIKILSGPLTISQISFDKKSQVENHVLMIGDAAGMITPLCGNGMSMALHASKIAAAAIHEYLAHNIARVVMEEQYRLSWNSEFGRRLATGRRMQRLLQNRRLTDLFISLAKLFPRLTNYIIRQTHGQPF